MIKSGHLVMVLVPWFAICMFLSFSCRKPDNVKDDPGATEATGLQPVAGTEVHEPHGEEEYCVTGCILICVDNLAQNLPEGSQVGYAELVQLGRQVMNAFSWSLPEYFDESLVTLVLVDSSFYRFYFQPLFGQSDAAAGEFARQFERNKMSASFLGCPSIACDEYVGQLLMRQHGSRDGALRHKKNIAMWRQKTRRWHHGRHQVTGCRDSCRKRCSEITSGPVESPRTSTPHSPDRN